MKQKIYPYVLDGYVIVTLGKCSNMLNEKTPFTISFDMKGNLCITSEQCLKK